MTLSEVLAMLRKRRGLSQSELAERAGISERQVSRYENGGAGVMSTATFARLTWNLADTDEELDVLLRALYDLRSEP